MNRDNILFLVIGTLLGFLAGYMIQERMADLQPQRRIHGIDETTSAASPPVADSSTVNPSSVNPSSAPQMPPGAPAAGGGPAMDWVRQLSARVRDNPEDADAVLQLANANFDIRNWGRAQELYEQYLELRPGDVNVTSDLGICQRALGDLDGALVTFDRALAQQPDHWLSKFNKALVLAIDLADYDAAEPILAELEAQRPEDTDIQRLVAEVARRRAAG